VTAGSAASTRTRRWLIALAVIVLSSGFISMEAYADWSPTQVRSTTVSSATMSIGFGTDELSIDANDVGPGDDVSRAVDVDVAGTPQMNTPLLSTSATTSSLLDTDTTHGLQFTIEICSQAWDETYDGGGNPTSATCAGSQATVIAQRAVIGTLLPLNNFDLTPGTTDHLLVKLSLPFDAPDSFQGLASVIQFTFGAKQPAAGYR
jgi:hypothetical protein